MKNAATEAKDGAYILVMGMLLGVLLAFVLHEYGVREATKAANNVTPPTRPTPPEPYFDGKNFVKGKTA